MSLERLYGTLDLRSTNDELREFEGVANTGALDDHGTIIEPSGARFSLPLPLLWFHDQKVPVGEVTHAELRSGKWFVRGTIRQVAEPGRVKDATDEAWHALKYKLIRGLSIGFRPLKEKANRFLEWTWREVSLVSIPSNQDANIISVRSAYVAASGDSQSPGVSGTTNPKRQTKMTTPEQITQHENSRAAKLAQRQSVFDKCGDEGRTPDAAEKESLETLARELEAHDEYLRELYVQRSANVVQATPVDGAGTMAASQTRGGVQVVRSTEKADKGIGFARYVMALVACQGNRFEAAQYAKSKFPDGEMTRQVSDALQTRAAVAAGTTTNATFAAPLVQTTYLNDFLELLRPATIIGRVPGMRHVPFNISLPTQTAGGTYSWVGQGVLKPVTNLQLSTVTLGMAKAAGIIVISEELARSSTPSAQEVVRDELLAGMTQYLDTQFIDPAVAAVANVSPASISNGVAGTAASGTTEAAARADFRALVNGFNTGNFGLGSVVILMGEGMAFTLGTMVNSVGAVAFPGLTATGGSILGLTVVTSNVLTTDIYAVHAPSILMADEGGIEIDVSREASLIMDSAPAGVTQAAGVASVYTSLWQANLVALRAERYINWGKARSTALRRIHTANYA